MSNSELVGMAKNRYTDGETMEAISKGYYRLAKEYLAQNPNITPTAAQELWNHRGYVFKAVAVVERCYQTEEEGIRGSLPQVLQEQHAVTVANDAGVFGKSLLLATR